MLLWLLACADPEPPARCEPTPEACNGEDDDCDGVIDDNTGEPRYEDADGDGYGGGDHLFACVSVSGRADVSGDCDDAYPAANPGAAEACGGGDEDCDGSTDEDGSTGCIRTWADADGDGVGTGEPTCACSPDGALVDGDCDDADPDLAADCATHDAFATPDVVLTGTDASDSLGWRLASTEAGLVVSANGQVTWLLPTPASGEAALQAAATFTGGAWMTAGDLGGDGALDLVFARPDLGGDGEAWVTYVFTAPFSAELTLDDATWSWAGPGGSFLGWMDAKVAGDVDGDDVTDLLVGGLETEEEDAVRRIGAGVEAVLFRGDDLGTRLCGPGDLDGDGLDDLALGGGDLAVYIFSGPAVGVRVAADADATVPMDLVLLERAGDADGDGGADLLVGEPGRLWLVAGPPASGSPADVAFASLGGEDADDLPFPAAVAADVDGDALSDVLAGDLLRAGSGAAYLSFGPLSGALDLSQADVRLDGAAAGDYLGSALAIDGSRAWVAAPGADDAADDAGAVYGFSP